MKNHTDNDYKLLLENWNISLEKMRPDLPVPGSPERCLFRTVAQDDQGDLYLLESIASGEIKHRTATAKLLHSLEHRGMTCLAPYLATGKGQYFAEMDGKSWQASRFIIGEPLPIPEYVQDMNKGRAIATFIANLQERGAKLDTEVDTTFSLPGYVDSLMSEIKENESAVHEKLVPIRTALNPLFENLDTILPALSHGDLHPLNIIWGVAGIRTVIDWEFAGIKPMLYDAALCAGCVGIEDPTGLTSGLVPEMIHTLRERGKAGPKGGKWLFPMMIATRFGWLSEWLRKNDREMVEMELDYLDILLRYGDRINAHWVL